MRYVDGFVIPIPKKNVKAYRRLAQHAGKVWRRLGALQYLECIGDDLAIKLGVSFTKLAKVRRGETVFFSFVVYRSRAHRDRVNAKIMKDPQIKEMVQGKPMPFDMKRMTYGGFKALVDL